MPPQPALAGDIAVALCAAYAAGESTSAIASRLHVSRTTVQRTLTRSGCPARKQGGQVRVAFAHDALVEIARRLDAGATLSALADEQGVSRPTLVRRLRAAGLLARRRS